MERTKINEIKDRGIFRIIDFILQNAENISGVDSNVPSAPADLKVNESRLIGTDLYKRFPNGKLIKFTGTEVT